MVDLKTQYLRMKDEIDSAVLDVIDSTQFIGGPKVVAFRESLEKYLGVKHVIPCANGTDALQIAMMALGLNPGDEVMYLEPVWVTPTWSGATARTGWRPPRAATPTSPLGRRPSGPSPSTSGNATAMPPGSACSRARAW